MNRPALRAAFKVKREPNQSGFTLIELLVVIAIIALLASVILSSLARARAKARDARRLADLKELQTALELYASENNGFYPSTGGAWHGNCAAYGGYGTTGPTGWIPNLAPTDIAVLPLDPNPIPPSYCYLYNSNGTDYMLLAYQTVETYTQANNPELRPLYPWQPNFAIYTSGAQMW